MNTKLFLTLLLCTCIKFAFGAITINGPSTAVSGADITFTAAGETATSYIVAVTLDREDSTIPSGVTVSDPDLLKMYNAGISVGTFKTNAFLPQGGPQAMITYAFTVQIQGQVDPSIIKKTVTITPSTAPPTSNYGLVVGNISVITGHQIFFTVTGETSNNAVTAATYDAAKSTIPTGITISGTQITTVWSGTSSPTVLAAVATLNNGSTTSATCIVAWDLTIKGITGKVTVSASVTITPPPPPIMGNVIAVSSYTFGGPLTITGQTVTGGNGSPIYQWEIMYPDIPTGGTRSPYDFYSVSSSDFDQISDNVITRTTAMKILNTAIVVRRKITVNGTDYYSNVLDIIPPVYTGQVLIIVGAPGEQNSTRQFTKNSNITLTVQNPNPNVIYSWYYTPEKPPLTTTYLGTGTSINCNSGNSVISGLNSVQIDVFGSDGSHKIFFIKTTV